jgi:hypothetical protein
MGVPVTPHLWTEVMRVAMRATWLRPELHICASS